jgi:hypothetical protein
VRSNWNTRVRPIKVVYQFREGIVGFFFVNTEQRKKEAS